MVTILDTTQLELKSFGASKDSIFDMETSNFDNYAGKWTQIHVRFTIDGWEKGVVIKGDGVDKVVKLIADLAIDTLNKQDPDL